MQAYVHDCGAVTGDECEDVIDHARPPKPWRECPLIARLFRWHRSAQVRLHAQAVTDDLVQRLAPPSERSARPIAVDADDIGDGG